MAVSIDLKGLKKARKHIEKSSRKATSLMNQATAKASIFVQGEVKMSIAGRRSEHTSVDTGRFLNSVGIRISKNNAEVFSRLQYAKKLEFGTNFKNSPRRHFRNTAKRTKAQVKKIFSNEIKKI